MDQFIGLFKYAAKAAVAALSPVVVELVDNLLVEMSSVVQTAVAGVLAAVAVYFTKNNYGAKPLK